MVIAFAIIAAQLLVALVESFIVIGAGVLFLGFAGSRWTKFFTERYLSYVASIGVKLFVLYLIMGVGMGIAARWMPVLERGGFSPIPFFYVMGGSLVCVFLTWHIPAVAGSMMAGAVSLSLADAVYPAIWGSRAAGAGVIAAGAVGGAAVSAGRWAVDRLRVSTSLHVVNEEVQRLRAPSTSVSATPPRETDMSTSRGAPEPPRSKAPRSVDSTRDPAGGSETHTTSGSRERSDQSDGPA